MCDTSRSVWFKDSALCQSEEKKEGDSDLEDFLCDESSRSNELDPDGSVLPVLTVYMITLKRHYNCSVTSRGAGSASVLQVLLRLDVGYLDADVRCDHV